MGSDRSEIGVKIRKGLIFTIRCCCRSVCRHPFLVGFLCFLILLYRSSPFVFSLLVSASPILICTAVLLGVLLSYGEPNIPEIEIEGKKADFETNGIYFIKEKDSDDTSPLIEERSQEIKSDVEGFEEKRSKDSDDTAPLIEEGSQEIKSEEEGENRELSDLKLKTEWVDEIHESDSEKSEADSFDSEKVNVDSLDSPPHSPWTRIEEGDEDEHAEEEEDSGSDSESDRAESSSPDASMADIMPMLDELHPLLDEEMIPHQSIRGSRSGSDVALQKSSESSTESFESGDESEENHRSLDGDDDDDNEDGEDDAEGDKEEPTKSAIRWTEEDQKNLMDLGSSEIERNQRLENLIMRRRSKKHMNIAPERNLIDLESTDHPFSLAPISTRKKNPFDDLTQDSYDDLGLPPIPGSAPSVMLQRRNPFDIPYDSSEEKPDLMGDGFKEEFVTSQSRGPTFRRHESFNVGPSVFAPGGKGSRMRPYFVPESMISEESSYSSSFMRQSSELSESKVSSVPETESTGSVQDLDERKLSEEDNQQEIEVNEVLEGPSEGPQLSYHHEEEGDQEEEEEEEEEVNGAPELISEIENVPELVGHGSESSDDEESQVEIATETYHQNYEGGEEVYRRDSSSSSLSEESERVFTEIESEELSVFSERRDVAILTQTSTERLNLVIPHRGPVYDSSPRPNENILAETSITHPMYVVDQRDHEDVNVDSSEVEKEISEVSTSLNLSVEILAVEEHGLGEVSGEKDDEEIHNLNKSLEDQFEVSEPKEVRETFQRTDENEFISTDSVEGNAYPFHDADEIHGPNFQHLDEVLASSALIELESSEDAQITENLNTPEAQELDLNMSSNMQSETVGEEDVMNEIDLDLLAELDNIGDFSVQQWVPSEFERHVDSVEESEIKYLVHSEKSREDIDIEEEGVERIEVSRTEFHESGGQDSPNSKASEKHEEEADEKIQSFLEDKSVASVENEITYTENSNGMTELEAAKIEDIDAAFREITTNETTVDFKMGPGNSTVVGSTHVISKIEVQLNEKTESFSDKAEVAESEVIDQGQAETEITNLEASKVEDIDLAFKEIIANEMIVNETLVENSKVESSNVEVVPIEKDTSLDSKQSLSDSVDHALHVIEPEETPETFSERRSREIEVPSKENEAQTMNYVGSHDYEGKLSEAPEVEVQPIEKTESFSDKAELAVNEVNDQGQADTDMTELEASKVEDIDLAFKEITAKETIVKETLAKHSKENEKTESFSDKAELAENEVNDQGQADTEMTELEASKVEDIDLAFKEITTKEMIVKETLTEHSKDESSNVAESLVLEVEVQPSEKTESFSGKAELAENEVNYQGQADTEMTDLEATKVEDIDLAFKEITAKEMIVKETLAEHSKDENSNLAGSTLESSVPEVVPIEKETSLDSKQSLPDSIDRALHETISEETKGNSSEETALPPIDKVLELQKPNSDNELAEVKKDEVGPSVVESSVQEIGVAAEKPDSEDETPKDSKSSSSSSSSSSDSSSSESDEE